MAECQWFRRISVCLFLGVLPCSLTAQENDPDARSVVYAEVLVADVNVTKVRSAGFDFGTICTRAAESGEAGEDPTGDPREFIEFLRRRGVANRLFNPQVMSLIGKQVTVKIGGRELELTPLALPSGEIRMNASIRIAGEVLDAKEKSLGKGAQAHFALATTIDLQPGRTYYLGQMNTRRRNAKNELEDRCMLVLIRASFEPEVKSAAPDGEPRVSVTPAVLESP